MTDKNDNQEIPPLSTIIGNIARARQMAEDNNLELLSYMLRIAECEAGELVAKAVNTHDHRRNEANTDTQSPRFPSIGHG